MYVPAADPEQNSWGPNRQEIDGQSSYITLTPPPPPHSINTP